MSRRWRNLLALRLRRGGFLTVPPVEPPPALELPPGFTTQQRRGVSTRRGRFLAFVETVEAAPAVPPHTVRRADVRPPSPARSQFLGFVSAPADIPDRAASATPRRLLLARRGQFFVVIKPPPLGPGPLMPALIRRARARFLPTRAGEFAHIVPLQVAAPVITRGDMAPAVRAAPTMRGV